MFNISLVICKFIYRVDILAPNFLSRSKLKKHFRPCEGNAAFTQGQGRMCYMHSPGGVWYSGMKCKPAPPIQSVSLVVFKGATLDIWIIGGRGVVVNTSALESEDPGSIPGVSNTFSKCPKWPPTVWSPL